jgi:carbamoyltransferase
MSTFYLGLSTSGHDPALAIVDASGQPVFAEAAERFVQDKRAWGIAPDHVSHLERALEMVGFDRAKDRIVVASTWSVTKADIPVQVSNAMLPATDGLWLRSLQAQAQKNAGASLLRLGLASEMPDVLRFDHHLCHAVAACFQSPMDNAVCLVIDGEGEVGAASLFDMRERSLKRRWRSWGPGSLGTFYAWLTMLCGFDWRLGEEWKVMGLAAFGEVIPELAESLAAMLIVDNGRLRFADDGLIDAARKAAAGHARSPSDPILQAANLASTGQAVYGHLADRILMSCANPGTPDLILTGGCALNSSYNGTIAGRAGFDRVFVPSAPADDGNAVGAAILAWMKDTGASSIPAGDGSPYLGSTANPKTLAKAIRAVGAAQVTEVSGNATDVVAERLERGHIIGVMRGRAEFGPRALGHRSILADPRPAEMKDRINLQVKGREAYRPFAPVVPLAQVDDWFERSLPSPYMSFTLRWRQQQRQRVPAVVHEDGTGRLQTVTPTSDPWMNDMVENFGRRTGVPVILNTSFNVMGRPIVHSVEDAVAVLMTSGLDGLLIENILIEK